MADQPGPYVIIHNNLVVTSEEARASAIIERLPAGTRVNVLEVVRHEEGKKQIRGRIDSPQGWVTLLDQDRCLRGATPAASTTGEPAGPIAASVSPPPQRAAPAATPAVAAAAAPPALVSAPSASSVPAPAPARSSAAASSASERQRRLEAEARELVASHAQAKTELASATAYCADLEARWTELSEGSDDALRGADEGRQQAALLRRALEDKNARLAETEPVRETLAAACVKAKTQQQELEAAFQQRLRREVCQKEQQLLEEKASLRKQSEATDRRIQELVVEKARLEQLDLMKSAAGIDGGATHNAMLEAHGAIAQAFAELTIEHPCLRCVDKPALDATVLLFKQPLFRRCFFALSALMWLFAVIRALTPQGTYQAG